MMKKSHKFLAIFLGSLSLFLGGSIYLREAIFFNLTPSLPYGVWLQDESSLAIGSYVVFCPTHSQLNKFEAYKNNIGSCEAGYKPMLKRVKHIDGDHLFVVGDHPKSYDSKVFGEISRNQIVTTVKPFFVWNYGKLQ